MVTNIYNYNGSLLVSVADGVLDTGSASIKFPGDGYLNYGQPVNENMLWIMQNFARATQPDNPVTGQTWYDTGNSILKIYNGSGWVSAGNVISATVAPDAATLSPGTFWYDTVNDQVFVGTGTEWLLVGPLGSSVNADPENPVLPSNSSLQAVRVTDDVAASHQIWRIIIGGTLVGIISKDAEFTPDPAISGFAKIRPGLNFNTSITNIGALANSISGGATGSVLYQSSPSTTAFLNPSNEGYVLTSNGAGVAPSWSPIGNVSTVPNLAGGSAGSLPYQSAPDTTAFLSGGATGAILTSASPSAAPYWATGVTNLQGGSPGSIPYQSTTGTTSFIAGGSNGYVLTSNGVSAAPTWQSVSTSIGINMVTYTTAGSYNWTVPVTGKYKITVVGGGGGGGSSPNVPGSQNYCGGAGGGAGGASIGIYQLTAGTIYPVIVGAAGTGGAAGGYNAGSSGGTSSVTGLLSATGGNGGACAVGGSYNGPTGSGTGSLGNILNLNGGYGASGGAPWYADEVGGVGGAGGASIFGGLTAPGSGGTGASGNNASGGVGYAGIVTIEWVA